MYDLTYFLLLGFNLVLITGLHITVLTYGISSKATSASNAMGYIAPAIELGVQALRNVYGFNVSYVVLTRPDILTCDDELMNLDMVSNFYYTHYVKDGLFVIISAGCETTIPLSRLSREWYTLILSCGASFPEVRNKSLHPTAVSMTTVGYKTYRQGLIAMLLKFAWSTVVLIHDTVDRYPFYKLLAKEIQLNMPEVADLVSMTTFPINSSGSVNISYASLLERASHITRVIILACHANEIRAFMVVASQLGMTDSNYVYFALEPFKARRGYGDILLQLKDSYDEVALDAYHQLFQMSSCTHEQTGPLQTALHQIKKNAVRDYNAFYFPMEQPSEISLTAYFAARAFTQVLNETFYSSDSVYDAVNMAKRFRNRTFLFDVGSMYVDFSGERLPDYCFKRLSNISNSFEDVLRFSPTSGTLDKINSSNMIISWNTPDGSPPLNVPLCGFSGKLGPCKQGSGRTSYLVAIVAVIVILFGISVIATKMYGATIAQRGEWWRIPEMDLINTNTTTARSSFLLTTKSSISMSVQQCDQVHRVNAVFLNGAPVRTIVFGTLTPYTAGNKARKALSEIKNFTHNNIARLLGIHVNSRTLTVVFEFCQKGDLADVLERLQLDWSNRLSLLSDIIEGLYAIHGSFFQRHGFISPFRMFINNRLTLQIGDLGIFDILCDTELAADSDKELFADTQSRWTAPELKRFLSNLTNLCLIARYAKPEADIYSLGAVIMFMKEDCETDESLGMDTISVLARACLADNASHRPSIVTVRGKFRKAFPRAGDLAQNLITRMQNYAQKLEEAVSERTVALLEERRLCEELLAEMMPRMVVSKLLQGITVEAENFQSVTVLFSYIIRFLDFVAQRIDRPEKVVAFLNQIFTKFDRLLAQCDIYKVETISDTYMAVSGLPEPNDKHASEICKLSLQLRDSFETATKYIEPKLEIGIGINSGPCAAGVVGNKRPRYCLFGDTVNTASRLATHGSPSMIHISSTTAMLIKDHKIMETISRGIVYLKGKGTENTFWLQLKSA